MNITQPKAALGLILILVLLMPTASLFAQDGSSTRPDILRLDTNQLRHEYQGWNNCGPSTLTMGLSYFNYSFDQYRAAEYLKPNIEDKNVSPWEMVEFVNESGLNVTNSRALYRAGGTLDLLKDLLAADFPVIIEKGYEPEGYDWMGHYLLLMGYNEIEQVFYSYDSFAGHGNFQGLRETYSYISNYWWHFNNIFIVIYEPAREAELMELLGDLADPDMAYGIAGQYAQERYQENPNDAWALFNIGDALSSLGQHENAAIFFRDAFELGTLPWRTLWYRFTPFESFYQIGDFNTVLTLIDNNLRNTPYVEEWYYYRALVLASRGDEQGARNAIADALRYNSTYEAALQLRAELDAGSFVGIEEVQ